MDSKLHPPQGVSADNKGDTSRDGHVDVQHQRGVRDSGQAGAKRVDKAGGVPAREPEKTQVAESYNPSRPQCMRRVELTGGEQLDLDVVLHRFWTRSAHARLERLETMHADGTTIPVALIRDRGWPEPVWSPEGRVSFPGCREHIIIRVRQRGEVTLIPEGCGEYLGSVSDVSGRWLVFRWQSRDRRAGSSARAESSTAGPSGAPKHPSRQPSSSESKAPSRASGPASSEKEADTPPV